jgi:hypothetical protein
VKRAAGLFLLFCGAALPAHATEWYVCDAPDGAAYFNVLAPISSDHLTVIGAIVGAGDKNWSTSSAYGPGDPIVAGQAFEDAETIRVDVIEQAETTAIAELRLFKSHEGDTDALAGTMRIIGVGAWPVICTGQ